jgi:cytochrome c553
LGGLRLDSLDAMTKGGKSGPALKPGDPDASLLIKAVRQTDPNLKMPMGGKLKDSQIEDLVAWVKAGAKWPAAAATTAAAPANGKYVIAPERRAFWSLQPLQDPKPPAVKDPKWARTVIDSFILAKLEQEGLKPVKPAAKRDLLRRAYFDLTGLPPTPEDTAAFLKDLSPDAFAKVVDRLLASPQYGERWGRLWLDVARFGEDDYRSLNPNPRGYRPYPNAHLYRDWVIQAHNDDLPYDTFVKAQLAGDLLDAKTKYRNVAATGFLGLGPWYYDNGSVEVTRADERHDRVDVVTRGFLGLTVACARCHDHKYDPIPATDYYSLAGVFLNTSYHEYPRAPKSVVDAYAKVEGEVEKKQKIIQEMQQNFSAQLSESLAFKTSNYLQGVFEIVAQKREIDTVVESRKLDYELAQRWIRYMEKPTDKYKFKEAWQAMIKRAAASPGGRGGGRGMGAPPATPPPATNNDGGDNAAGGGVPPVAPAAAGGMGGRGGRGGAGGGNAESKRLADEFQANVVRVMLARKELNEENEVIIAKSLEGTKKKKRAQKPNEFITNDDFCPNCGLRLKTLAEDENNFWTEIFQRELRDSEDPNAMMAMGGRMGKPGVLLFRGWGLESRIGSEAQTQMAAVRTDIEEARKKLDPAYPFVHGVRDVEKPVELPLAIRGNPENLGAEVPRHYLSILTKGEPAPFKNGSGRRELAENIVKEPIAMRVIVNRIWKGHFGTGLVDTPSNFGVTGERPTNPGLLEYLASSFVKNGMSMKKLHREIMLSSVYQLSADNDEAAAAKDSGNRFYWRFNRKRLEAEQLRDSVLQVAGNLDTATGGPSAELSPAFTRRTVYGKVSRYKLDEFLQIFDFPAPNISAEKRFTTTVPTQRLFLINSDFMQYEAEQLAKRVAGEPDNRSRIRKVYQLIYGRDPSEPEMKAGIDYLRAEPLRQYEELKAAPPAPAEPARPEPETAAAPMPPADAPAFPIGMGMMGGMGRGGRGPAAAPTVKYEATAWGRYIKVLFNSSEFLFIN